MLISMTSVKDNTWLRSAARFLVHPSPARGSAVLLVVGVSLALLTTVHFLQLPQGLFKHR